MTKETFQEQVRRLQATYGEKSYPLERAKLFWKTYQHEHDEVFIAAVDLAIAHRRSAPMFSELDEHIIEARKAETSRRFTPMGTGTIASFMREAEKVNRIADKDFVKLCVQTVMNHGKRTSEQSLDAHDSIDKLAKQLSGGTDGK